MKEGTAHGLFQAGERCAAFLVGIVASLLWLPALGSGARSPGPEDSPAALESSVSTARVVEGKLPPRKDNAGLAGCAGAPDGAPCDDLDLCTTNDSCHGGRCLAGGAAPFTVAPGWPAPAGDVSEDVGAGDFNLDGDPDLAVVNSRDVTILLGDGTGAFRLDGSLRVPASPRAVAIADFDLDHDLDLAVVSSQRFVAAGVVTILLGDGTGGFAPAAGSPVPVGYGATDLAVADLNRDGRPDLAVANFGNVTILLGHGTGRFTEAVGSPARVGIGPNSIAVTDFNRDGNPDLAVVNSYGNSVTVLLGDGTGRFAESSSSPISVGVLPMAAAPGDFNADGRPDLAVVSYTPREVAILLGDGAGGFGHAPGSPVQIEVFCYDPRYIAVGDFNLDGWADLVVGPPSAKTLLGDGTGRFTLGPGPTVFVGWNVAIGDFNLDGRADLAVANHDSPGVSILLGQPGLLDCDDGRPCTADTCDPTTGCSHAEIPPGGACEDGCFMVGTCDPAGACVGVPGCSDHNECTSDSCTVVRDACGAPTVECLHTPIDCDDENPCTLDSCQAYSVGCVHRPVCDDQNACTLDGCDPATAACDATPVDCDDGNECTTDTCDPPTGCSHTAVASGASCNDRCTSNGTCDSYARCLGGSPSSCDDENPCTADSCHPVLGCWYAPTVCEDIAPAILSEPAPQTMIEGGEAIFTVIASGRGPLTYRWRKDGVDLADGPGVHGADRDVLILSEIDLEDKGQYSVVVSSGSGKRATSADAGLTVHEPQGGDVDYSFDPRSRKNGVEGAFGTASPKVSSVTVQPDGRILVAGNFKTASGVVRGGITRLNPDGTIDPTFLNGMSGADGPINAVVLQADRKVLIGGEFSTVNGVSRRAIARLNVDGSVDTSFQAGVRRDSGQASVLALALGPDGKVLIAGAFNTVNGARRNAIARLNSDGSFDPSFDMNVGADDGLRALALQPDGKVVVGGAFTTRDGVGRRVARLNADGSVDRSFLDTLSGLYLVNAMALQPDGKLVVGGSSIWYGRVARLNADGSVDTTFRDLRIPGRPLPVSVFSVVSQPDGRVLIGGNFVYYYGGGGYRPYVARLNVDGSLDTTFLAGASSSVYSVALQPDGKVLLGGVSVNGPSRNGIARFNADGSLDTSFLGETPEVYGQMGTVVQQPDGKVLIGGSLTMFNGVSLGLRNIARLRADGSLDGSFLNGMSGAGGAVNDIALQPDGKILIGGSFYAVNGVSRGGIARLNADGSLDGTFLNGMSGAGGAVNAIALQPDGKVVIGGGFGTVNGASHNGLARLNADGSLDESFQARTGGISTGSDDVYSIALDAEGSVLIAGNFTVVNGVSRNRVARLKAHGGLDAGFLDGLSGANGEVDAIALQADGKVLIGGFFGIVNGAGRDRIARLKADGSLDTTFLARASSSVYSVALQPDGKVLLGGAFDSVNGASRNGIARLNADGSLDTSFQDGLGGASDARRVSSVWVQPDGKVLIAGAFTRVNGVTRNPVARLHGSTPVPP